MHLQQLGILVKDVLSQDGMAVLPGFGGFITERSPASVDAHRGRISPPSRIISFQSRLSHNDGAMAQAAARHMGIPLAEADSWLTDAVQELRFVLQSGQEVAWPGIGSVKLTAEGRTHFAPGADSTSDPLSFGLVPVQAMPHGKREAMGIRQLPLRKVAGYAAAALLAGIMVYVPLRFDVGAEGRQVAVRMGIAPQWGERAYAPRTFDMAWADALLEGSHSTEAHKETVVDEVYPKDNGEAPVPASAAAPATRHRVIFGAYASREAAQAQLQLLMGRGFAAVDAGPDSQGQHLVAYGEYRSLQDAEAMLASVRLSNKQAAIVSLP